MHTPLSAALLASVLDDAKRAHLAGDFARARRLYGDILRLNPDEVSPQALLAELDIREGKLMTAKGRLESIIAHHPQAAELRAALASLLEELGDVEATTTFYREETALRPGASEAWVKLANAYQVAGRLNDAIDVFRHVATCWPDAIAGYFGLAASDPSLLSPDDVRHVREIAEDPQRSLDERIHAYFALGNILEGSSAYDEAFGAFLEGNRLRRENPHLSGELPAWLATLSSHTPVFTSVEQAERANEGIAQETKRNFSAAYLAKFAGRGEPSNAPIFIIGMPRSGSTLLEQILSSHPEVQGLGETAALSRVFKSALAEVQREPAGAPTFYSRLGRAYLTALKELGWDGTRRVIDKMLGNYVNVGIIHLALPNAVILNSVRDPMDTCLSCFRQLFGKRNEQSYDLAAIGRQYVSYREMLAHWERVLPGRIINVSHEELLADPERSIRNLVSRSTLPWNDACLRFNENRRTVRTASVAQVRRPLSSSAVDRWRKYERHLGPLIDALGAYGPRGIAPPN
jgi:tetratricopeptide (TPR) repeat protein